MHYQITLNIDKNYIPYTEQKKYCPGLKTNVNKSLNYS